MQTQNALRTVDLPTENSLQRLTQTDDAFCLPTEAIRKKPALSPRYANLRPFAHASATPRWPAPAPAAPPAPLVSDARSGWAAVDLGVAVGAEIFRFGPFCTVDYL
jgi:hypothetical protein